MIERLDKTILAGAIEQFGHIGTIGFPHTLHLTHHTGMSCPVRGGVHWSGFNSWDRSSGNLRSRIPGRFNRCNTASRGSHWNSGSRTWPTARRKSSFCILNFGIFNWFGHSRTQKLLSPWFSHQRLNHRESLHHLCKLVSVHGVLGRWRPKPRNCFLIQYRIEIT